MLVHLISLLQHHPLSNSHLCQPCPRRTKNTSSHWSAQALQLLQLALYQSTPLPTLNSHHSNHPSAPNSTQTTNSALSTSPTQRSSITVTRDRGCPHTQVTRRISSANRALVLLTSKIVVLTPAFHRLLSQLQLAMQLQIRNRRRHCAK